MPAWLRAGQRNTDDEKKAIKEGRIPQDWKDKPAKLRQKDRDARWTVKFTKAKPREDGSMPPVDLAIPLFGYQNHVSIDRGFGFIRRWTATDAAAYEGRRLREGLLDKTNTASGVWADTAYRSAANETFLNRNGFVSHIHRKKPNGRAMPETTRRANNAKSKIRSRDRACVRRAKGSDGAVHQNHRDRPGNDQDRNGQSRLQHQTLYLPAQDRRRMRGSVAQREPIGKRQLRSGENPQPVCCWKISDPAEIRSLIEASSYVFL